MKYFGQSPFGALVLTDKFNSVKIAFLCGYLKALKGNIMQSVFLSFFVIFALAAPKLSNGLQVNQQIKRIHSEKKIQDWDITRAQGSGKTLQVARQARGVTIWLGPHWIGYPRGGGGGQHLPSEQNLAGKDAAMMLVGKRR